VFHELLSKQIESAALNVFETMLGIKLEPGEARQENAEAGPTNGVVAVVGLAGRYSGIGSITCSIPAACVAAEAMLMTPYETVNEDVLDAVGELANMIIGNIKTNLEAEIGEMGLSTPTVIHGENVRTRVSGSHKWTMVPFKFNGHEVLVQMMITENASAPVSPGPVLPVTTKA
jgi:chemotaxis protein CheX